MEFYSDLIDANWRKPYPTFYGSELLIIKGSSSRQEN